MSHGVEINKRRLRLSRLRRGTTFVLFRAMRQGGQKHTFWPPFFVFSQRQTGVSLAGQRNEKKKAVLKKIAPQNRN
jgi:hypothetical protein